MNMKIKRKELNNILNGISSYDEQKLQIFRLTLLLTKNNKIIKDENDLFEEVKGKILPMKEIEEYKEKQRVLVQKYYAKDEKGEYIMYEENGQSMHALIKTAELNDQLEKLQKDYIDSVTEYNEGMKKVIELLEEEIELPLLTITDIEHVKHLNSKTFTLLAPIIECVLPEYILEEKGKDLKTADLERILNYCTLE